MYLKFLKVFFIFIFLIVQTSILNCEEVDLALGKPTDPPFLTQANTAWVDSVFNTLSLEEKIAQLLMVAAYSNKDKEHVEYIDKLIKQYKIGGLIFMQGGPVRQANLTNQYQSESNVPLMIAIDGEWGVSMRLDSTPRFPRQMMLGAIQDNSLIYEVGKEIAYQCHELGIHVNFGPVIDVNNNPLNPVINSRSFGENKYNVAIKGYNYMAGMQDNKILATAKHFPGHGDTQSDSHQTLPTIPYSAERLDSLELYPFKELIKSGVGSIMVAHLYIPALDSTKNQASTLSKKIVTDLLQDSLKFKGLIFTDALNMKGVSDFYKPGEVDLEALLAGNDVLLFSGNVPKAIDEIKKAIKKGKLSQEVVDAKCKKILMAKSWLGATGVDSVKTDKLVENLNSLNSRLLTRKLVENALTLAKNDDDIIPIKDLDKKKIACVAIGERTENKFQQTLDLYADIEFFIISSSAPTSQFEELERKLAKYDLVIASIHNTNRTPSKNFGITDESVKFIEKLSTKTTIILDVFANPYSLALFDKFTKIKGVVMSYEDTDNAQDLSAQLIFGGIPALGKLPVTASDNFKEGTGFITTKVRLKYSTPEELNMSSSTLDKIDSIAINSIKEKAFPGCQILAAKDGVVFYQKSFGYHVYDNKKNPVQNSDIYDLASITKVISTTSALMKLYEEEKFDLEAKMSKYLTYLDTTNKKDMLVKDVLTHQAQLTPWIPFWWNTTTHKRKKLRDDVYSKTRSDYFSVQVCDNLYIRADYRDTMYAQICQSELRDEKSYKYSDLGFYLFHDIVERETGEKLDSFVYENFYSRLGAKTLGYKPLMKFNRDKIVPTQDDVFFRHQLINGYVHDPGAAMFGGVAGHAGLFSNANDLAKMLQMYLQNGSYGGEQFLKKSTLDIFTSSHFRCEGNRRGLGFDKPIAECNGPACASASAKSYGHQGFTGTVFWVDPEEGLLYIFLSNRIHPDEENKKINKLDIRTNVQQVLYDAIKEAKKKSLSDAKKRTQNSKA